MKSYILTVTLNPTIDKVVYVDNFCVGKEFREEGVSIKAGGKGINVARVLASLGETAVATGFLATVGASHIENALGFQNIKSAFTWINGEVRNCLSIVDRKRNKVTRILERGPRVRHADISKFKQQYGGLAKSAKAVVLSGRSLPGVSEYLYPELISIANNKGAKTFFDTSGEPLSLGLQHKPFMIKPNMDEAEFLLQRKLVGKNKIKEALKELHNKGVSIVAITCGEKGAYIYDGSEILWGGVGTVNSGISVGCGDAFLAGFVSNYFKKKSLRECLALAVSCGAANMNSDSQCHISKAEIEKFFKEIIVKEL